MWVCYVCVVIVGVVLVSAVLVSAVCQPVYNIRKSEHHTMVCPLFLLPASPMSVRPPKDMFLNTQLSKPPPWLDICLGAVSSPVLSVMFCMNTTVHSRLSVV